MLATFIGTNKSEKLSNGKTYDIQLFTENNRLRVLLNFESYYYKNLEEFHKNWRFILKEPRLID